MPERANTAVRRELISRLPRTFAPALNDQLRQWDFLFPAERRSLQAQLDWISRLSSEVFRQLFAPIFALESRMELPRWNANTAGMSVQDVGILARSPLYPQWRAEVEKVFAQIDAGVQESGPQPVLPRLVICVLPGSLPLPDRPLWPELARDGKWIALDKPLAGMVVPLASALARRDAPGIEDVERTWIFEGQTLPGSLIESTPATVLSWASLAALRREFLKRLNSIGRDLGAVDQTTDALRRMDINGLVGARIAAMPAVREFVRALLLSGNGSLVFNNSFVQWGASEALRRVQPQVLIASFGIRQKIKPFSGTVLFEDQNRSNPVPDEDDPAGSLTDALILSKYVYLAAQRTARPQDRTMTLLASCDLDRVLVLGGDAVPRGPASEQELTRMTLDWLKIAR